MTCQWINCSFSFYGDCNSLTEIFILTGKARKPLQYFSMYAVYSLQLDPITHRHMFLYLHCEQITPQTLWEQAVIIRLNILLCKQTGIKYLDSTCQPQRDDPYCTKSFQLVQPDSFGLQVSRSYSSCTSLCISPSLKDLDQLHWI